MNKKIFLVSLVIVAAFKASPVNASVALVYESEQALKEGRAMLAPFVDKDILVPASIALTGGTQLLFGGQGEDLYRAVLVRLDNELGLALLRSGERIGDSVLQEAHQNKSRQLGAFLPAGVSHAASGEIVPATLVEVSPILIKINGTDISQGEIELKAKRRKSNFKLEVVYRSTVPAWTLSIELTSSPKLSFWQQGKSTSLNDVPQPTFNYDHQAFFKPMKDNAPIKLSLEAHFMEPNTLYEWTFRIKTKTESVVKTARVRFQ